MAFRRITFVNISVVFFIVCGASTHICASSDVYNIENQPTLLNDDAVSVIALEQGRYRRQVSSGSTTTQMTTTLPTTAPSTTPFKLSEANLVHDDHSYYESFMFRSTLDEYWVNLDPSTDSHDTLSNSHRTAVTAKLPFAFPFYGHNIQNVTIATGGFIYMSPFIHKFLTATQYIAPLMANFDTKSGGKNSRVLYRQVGFLYMSPFLHQWLTATQYIAPLMANFDTTIGNASHILYRSIDKKFVVEWRDVHLQDQNGTGTFDFQVILHLNGSIVFVYKSLPVTLSQISDRQHKVTVGLSDAFYIDTVSQGTKRRTIYEYHRVVLNTTEIREGTVVLLNPQPTCNRYKDCESCVSAKINFDCRWCGIIQKCSDSVDWNRQEWLNAGCVHLSGNNNCSLIPTRAPPQEQTQNNVSTKMAIIVIVVVLVVVLVGALGGWVYYAYTHPTSASGMWLMEHRPSQMKAKMANMKFWKRNGTTGDKYAVESTA